MQILRCAQNDVGGLVRVVGVESICSEAGGEQVVRDG